MPVKSTSIRAYNEEVRSGNIPTQNQRILDLLLSVGQPMSNRMIAQILNLETGAVSGRINGLMKSGLVKEAYYDTCRAYVKGKPKRVRYVEIVWPQPKQKEFKW